MRLKFTKPQLDKLLAKKPEKQLTVWDAEARGLCVLVSPGRPSEPKATVTFRVCYYLPDAPGRPVYKKLGRYTGNAAEIKAARLDAGGVRKAASEGKNPRRPKLADKPFEKVVDDFIEDHAKRKNRTWEETRRIFDRYVIPEWQGRRLEDIKRSEVMELLRKIADGKIRQRVEGSDGRTTTRMIGTPKNADAALAQIRALMNWYALSSDDYRSPIVKGMRRSSPGKRSRALSHDELRACWTATAQMGLFGAAVRVMLLTAQRVKRVEWMRRSEIKDRLKIEGHEAENGAWVPEQFVENVWDAVRDDDPENKQVSVVPLSAAARAIIDAIPVVDAGRRGEDYVFSLNGRTPINGRSKAKERLDKLMLAALRERAPNAELVPWELRDLRRTARTLMASAGVDEDLAERCLGHIMGGVRGVYNRYDYIREKREAFDKLARLIDRIVNPPEGDNVVRLPMKVGA
jgi:hypothetical protein